MPNRGDSVRDFPVGRTKLAEATNIGGVTHKVYILT